MKKKIASVGVVLGLLMVAQGVAGQTDQLWEQAVAMTKKSEGLFPRKMKEVETTTDEEGEVQEKTVSMYSIEALPGTGGKASLVSSYRYGQNYLAQKQKELKDMGETGEILDVDNLFHPAAQGRVKATRLKKTKTIAGIECAVFKFSHRTTDGVIKGKAFLNAKTGAPVQTSSWPVKLPAVEDDVEITSLASSTWYVVTKEGQLRTSRIVIVAKFKVDGFWFMNYKGKVKTVLTFSEYR